MDSEPASLTQIVAKVWRMEEEPVRYVRLLAVLTIVAIILSVGFLLWGLRDREINHSEMEVVSLTHMVMEQTERQFESVDLILQGVQERLQTPFGTQLALDSDQVRLLLNARVSGVRQIWSLYLLDAQGNVVNSSRDFRGPSANLADADYFRVFAEGRGDVLYVAKPASGNDDASRVLNLARPLFTPTGKLRGVAVAAISLSQFEQVYSAVQLDYVRLIGFYLEDGTAIAQWPHRDTGERTPGWAAGSLPAQASEVRTLRGHSVTGPDDLIAIGRLAAFPILVSVTDDASKSLSAWRETAWPIAVSAVLVSIFTALVAIYLTGKLQIKKQLAMALNAADERYQHTVNSVMDAIVAVDEGMHIVLFNPSAEKMFGLAATDVKGKTLDMLIPPRLRGVHRDHIRDFSRSHTASRSTNADVEVLGLRSDGTEFPLESTISHSLIGGKMQMTAVLRDATERRRTEAELRLVNNQLRELSVSLQSVREEERKRISRELHDDLGQQLTGLKLSLSWLGSRLKEGKATAVDDVNEMRRQLDAAIGSVRRIATELRPRVLDDLDFREALTWQTQDFFKHSNIAVELDLSDADQVRDEVLGTALFRIAQEALTNVVRHAEADRVTISLRQQADKLTLCISDNGRGFDAAVSGSGVGLVSMRERCSAIGAGFKVSSQPGVGTRLEVTVAS